MVSFGSTATGAATLLAVILSTSDAAAYVSHRTPRRHYSTALGARSRVPLFSRDVERVFRDFDYMFDSMMGDVESNFYSPLSLRRMTTPRLQQVPTKRQLSAPRATYQTSQDESEVRIAFNVPGAQASDIDLQLDEDKRILRITGETKLEEGDLHLSRKFDQGHYNLILHNGRRSAAKLGEGGRQTHLVKRLSATNYALVRLTRD
ncbi:hypothetical protein THAOC_03577 [Thalassiosira oceanica]|uniref:SHSP domain-containing protein n=1 Tax=Thalassiosira oceanica TaxID=159749 RepID=K0TC80_THAOC|nr:hypothetical protein THAOC_03577 [Thalassiosira oceanica]|eukprot:EJK74724.1 hypothetical protein THAOC_03577 [Thalassiosira oceanica]